MSSELELDEGIKSIKSAWRREHTARANLEKMFENAEAENAKLRELVRQMHPRAKVFLQMGVQLGCNDTLSYDWELQMRELGIEVPEQ